MKKFAQKHASELLWTTLVLALTVISLSVYLFFSFRVEQDRRESEDLLYRAEIVNTAENLKSALEAEDERLSYHYAASAADRASLAGDHDAAVMFRGMADSLLLDNGTSSAVKQAVEQYLASGTTEFDFTSEDAGADLTEGEFMNDDDVRPVSAYAVETAEKCLERVFGNHNTLRRGMKSRNGELLFSCSNAYAVIDERTGLPVEFAISLTPAEMRLTADECVQYALDFLEEYFPSDLAESADVRKIEADDSAGTFEIYCVSKNRQLVMSVRRDTGRVARFCVK